MHIFISHISEEASVATLLKEWFESTFPASVTVFVSSDPTSLPAGVRWLELLEVELAKTDLLITLFSPASVDRHWITFEAGSAWIRKIPIIPICHSGITHQNLPQPLPQFQGLDALDSKFGQNLFSSIAKSAGIQKVPRISFTDFQSEFAAAAASSASVPLKKEPSVKFPETDDNTLSDNQVGILKQLSAAKDRGHPRVSEANLARAISLSATRLSFEIKPLTDTKRVRSHYRVGGPIEHSISDQGIAYLINHLHIE